jgi:hypothetical protein
MAWETRKIMGALAFGVMILILRATAQETVYSADSLMAAFEKGSKVSLKGTQITFRDVVKESEETKVTFKSSHNDRVICRLVASKEDHSKAASVGGEITVTGKIRGRGLLGNVTLDNCIVAPVVDSEASPNPPQDVASTPADASSEESSTEDASLPAHLEEVRNDFAPIQSARPPKPKIRKEKQETAPAKPLEQQNQTTSSAPDSTHDVSYRFYVLLVLGGAVGYWILSKLLTSIAAAMRSSRYAGNTSGDEVRKAALELLLLKSSKKK